MADEAEVGSSAKMKDNGSVSSKTSVESGDEYEVEKIIGVCKSKGKTMYRVRWVGYDPSWDTWEPAENLESCIDVIQAFLQQKKEQKSKPTNTPKASVCERLNKEIFSEEESSWDGSVASSNSSSSSDKKRQKPAWKYVSSSDDEADTLKDKFWRDLEEGKVDVFQNDMYSKVKGEGTRTSRPESFKDMFKNKRLVQETDESNSMKKKRHSSERKSTESSSSQESFSSTEKKISGTGIVSKQSVKRKQASASLSSDTQSETQDNVIKKRSPSTSESSKKTSKPKPKSKVKEKGETKSKEKLVTSKKGSVAQSLGNNVDRSVVKVEVDAEEENSNKSVILKTEIKKEPTDEISVKCETSESTPSSPGSLASGNSDTLKDTFWRDLEEGKVNVFSADMYSKVKSSGRAARPKSFTDQPKEKQQSTSQSWKNSKEVKKTRISSELKKNLSNKRVHSNSSSKISTPIDSPSDEVAKGNDTPLSSCSSASTPGSDGDMVCFDKKIAKKVSVDSEVSSVDKCISPVTSGVQNAKDSEKHLKKSPKLLPKKVAKIGTDERLSSGTIETEQTGVVGHCSNVALLLEADPKLFKCRVLMKRVPLQCTSKTKRTTVPLCQAQGKHSHAKGHQQRTKKIGPKNPCNKQMDTPLFTDGVGGARQKQKKGKAEITTRINGQDSTEVLSENRELSNNDINSATSSLMTQLDVATEAPACISSAVSDEDTGSASKRVSALASIEGADMHMKDNAEEVKIAKRKRKHSGQRDEKKGMTSSKKVRHNTSMGYSNHTQDSAESVKDSTETMVVSIDANRQPSVDSQSMSVSSPADGGTRDQQLPQSTHHPTLPPPSATGSGLPLHTRSDTHSSHLDEVPLGSPQTGPHSNYSVQSCDSGVDISHERSFGTLSTSVDNGKDAGDASGSGESRRQQGKTAATEQGSSDKQLDFIEFDFELDPSVQQNVRQATPLDQVMDLNTGELRHAIKKNEFEKVRLALSRRKYDLEQADCNGVTLTMYCAMRGFDDMLELLVKNGSNVNAETKNGSTALIMACEQGLRCTVELLLSLGAFVNKFTATSGETALIKSVKRGHIHIVRSLLNQGCNFSSPISEHNAVKFAKAYNQPEIMHLLSDHIHRVTTEMESQVLVTLNNTARIVNQLFGLQCLALREASKFRISFKHELEPTEPGIGMLLFIAHARVSTTEVKCRFYGPCAVTSAILNGTKLHPLIDDGNFVMSFCPLHNGKNDLEINTVAAPTSKAKLVVCAYKAQLSSPAT